MRFRKIFWILLFVLGWAIFPRGALAQTFLTFEQFQSLKTVHQIEYIGDLQKFVVGLSAHPDLTSGEVMSSQALFQKIFTQFVSSAEATTLAERNQFCKLRSASHLSKTALYSNIENIRNCTEISENGSPKYYLPAVAERLVVLTEELKTRVQKGTISRSDRKLNEVIGTLQATISGFKQVGTSDGKNYQAYLRKASTNLASVKTVSKRATVNSTPKPAAKPVAIVASAPVTRTTPSSVASAIEPAKGGAAPTSVRASKDVTSDAPASLPTPAPGPALAPTPEAAYQCMYAGFVIAKNPKSRCQPFQKLPTGFVGDFFEVDQFLCPRPEEILCNPLIFGYEPNCGSEVDTSCKAKKPLCIQRSVRATQNCFDLSQEKQTRPQVLKIWQSPNGQKAYEDFLRALSLLCDRDILKKRQLRESALKDITQTCDVALKTMEQNLKDKFLPSLGPLEKRLKENRAKSSN